MKLLLYCTKRRPYLYKNTTMLGENIFTFNPFVKNKDDILNGKIVAECDYEMEEIIANDVTIYDEYGIKYTTKNGYSHIDDNFQALLDDSCLNAFELNDYLGGYDGKAIHIKNLHIFDTPRELNDYYKFVGIGKMGKECINNYISIKKAPQNMMYAYEFISKFGLSGTWNRYFNSCIIISIHPEHLCKILNGNKTIEVRKKVLKDMYKK